MHSWGEELLALWASEDKAKWCRFQILILLSEIRSARELSHKICNTDVPMSRKAVSPELWHSSGTLRAACSSLCAFPPQQELSAVALRYGIGPCNRVFFRRTRR